MAIELLVPRPRLIVPKPKSYIKLDMAFGVGAGTTLYDKSRYRSHGAITGASWATGLHGKCLDFDPTVPSYVEIPASYTQLNFTSEDFSGIVRVYLDTITPIQFIFNRGLHSTNGWCFLLHTNGRPDFETYQSQAAQLTYSNAGYVLVSNWYTLGFSRAGAAVKIYVNGVDRTDNKGIHVNPATCARSVKIGIHNDKVGYPWDGKIEFLRIFGGIALSASEHLAYHNALK